MRTSRKESRGSLDIGHTETRYTPVQTPDVGKSSTPLFALFLYMWRLHKITMSGEDLHKTEYLDEMIWQRYGP